MKDYKLTCDVRGHPTPASTGRCPVVPTETDCPSLSPTPFLTQLESRGLSGDSTPRGGVYTHHLSPSWRLVVPHPGLFPKLTNAPGGPISSPLCQHLSRGTCGQPSPCGRDTHRRCGAWSCQPGRREGRAGPEFRLLGVVVRGKSGRSWWKVGCGKEPRGRPVHSRLGPLTPAPSPPFWPPLRCPKARAPAARLGSFTQGGWTGRWNINKGRRKGN